MPKTKFGDFAEREREALSVATASDAEVLDLCHHLGSDPSAVAARIRKLLLKAVSPVSMMAEPPDPPGPALRLPDTGRLPLHRILVADDNPARLAGRLAEFRLHESRLGFAVETATSGEEALARLRSEKFEAILIDLGSPTEKDREMLDGLRRWSTSLAPILLSSEGMEVLELRKLNRDAVRALALGFGKHAPAPYRKRGPGRAENRRSSQSALFHGSDEKKTG